MAGKVGSENSADDYFSLYAPAAEDGTRRGVGVFNLGTGKGSSVLDVIHAFEKACGKTLKYEICPRRPGDVEQCYAKCSKAEKEMN